MATRTGRFNTFLFFKLPSAWWCGVRLRSLDLEEAVVTVRHSWFNQNPFKSMFWAVQGMAAELSTGAIVMQQIRESGRNVSMLVASNRASFSKKAIGKIAFRCTDGALIRQALEETIKSGEGQTFCMRSVGTNEEGLQVSAFEFEWTIKLRN